MSLVFEPKTARDSHIALKAIERQASFYSLVVHLAQDVDDDLIVEPTGRVHHEPRRASEFDRLISGEGFPPVPTDGPLARHAAATDSLWEQILSPFVALAKGLAERLAPLVPDAHPWASPSRLDRRDAFPVRFGVDDRSEGTDYGFRG